jgi:FAD dependent oxidoreductase TIGR03364
MQKSALVIGAGIVGLSIARALALHNYKVTVIERNEKAVGASIRNFGMVLPAAHPDGILYNRAMRSRNIWKEICTEAKIWHDEVGSLQLAYASDEWTVLNELHEIYQGRGYKLLNKNETLTASPSVSSKGLLGSLFSKDEIIIDPREAISKIPLWLEEKFNVKFIWGKAISHIEYPVAFAGNESFEADEIFICSGTDFETLYPDVFANAHITKCKLQMMRFVSQPNNWRLGPMLCAGLSLINYSSFSAAPSINILKKRIQNECPEHIKWGIHVMVSQHELGELCIGDSHEYGLTHDPFDRMTINNLILDYLKNFIQFKDMQICETWNGLYSKMTHGETEFIHKPQQGITIINGMGGAGMTLSFGLAEELVNGNIGINN